MVQHVQYGCSGAGAGLHQQFMQEMSVLEAHSPRRVLQRDETVRTVGRGTPPLKLHAYLLGHFLAFIDDFTVQFLP